MDNITSSKNPIVARFRSLQTRRGRETERAMLVESEKLMLEALDCGLAPREALVLNARVRELEPLIALLERAGARIYSVPEHVLSACCDTKTPNGCCASFELPRPLNLSSAPKLIVALDGVQDPGNCGTIWRTADAAGFGGLLIGGGSADMFQPKAVRSAMGSAFRLPALYERDLPSRLTWLRELGYEIIVTSLDGAPIYEQAVFGPPFVLVIGSEARGVSPEVDALATRKLKLPMRGGAESLNAAVAAGIIMYELTRGL